MSPSHHVDGLALVKCHPAFVSRFTLGCVNSGTLLSKVPSYIKERLLIPKSCTEMTLHLSGYLCG